MTKAKCAQPDRVRKIATNDLFEDILTDWSCFPWVCRPGHVWKAAQVVSYCKIFWKPGKTGLSVEKWFFLHLFWLFLTDFDLYVTRLASNNPRVTPGMPSQGPLSGPTGRLILFLSSGWSAHPGPFLRRGLDPELVSVSFSSAVFWILFTAECFIRFYFPACSCWCLSPQHCWRTSQGILVVSHVLLVDYCSVSWTGNGS